MTTVHATIPDDLHELLLADARQEGVTVETLVTRTLRARMALPLLRMTLEERAARGSLGDLRDILAKVPDVPPMPGDELPEGYVPIAERDTAR